MASDTDKREATAVGRTQPMDRTKRALKDETVGSDRADMALTRLKSMHCSSNLCLTVMIVLSVACSGDAAPPVGFNSTVFTRGEGGYFCIKIP